MLCSLHPTLLTYIKSRFLRPFVSSWKCVSESGTKDSTCSRSLGFEVQIRGIKKSKPTIVMRRSALFRDTGCDMNIARRLARESGCRYSEGSNRAEVVGLACKGLD